MKKFSTNLFLVCIFMHIFTAEKPQDSENEDFAIKRSLLAEQQADQRLDLEKSRKWRIKKKSDGLNCVDRDTSPTKGIKVVDCSHKNDGNCCITS